MAEIWENLIKYFTDQGVSRGIAIAYLIVSALLVVMAIVALFMWIYVAIKYYGANRKKTSSGKTSFEVAREMLDKCGLKHIQVKKANIFRAFVFGNCYSITKKTVFLRRSIANKDSITAVGMALQKVGIAKLCESGDKKAIARNRLQIVGLFGPILFIPIVLIGAVVDFFLFGVFGIGAYISIGISLAILLASFVVTLLNIPVEKKANNMAMSMIKESQVLNAEEQALVKKVFDAYIVAYICDFIVSVLRIIQIVLEIVMGTQKSNS